MKKNEEENSTGNPTRNRKAGEAIHTQFQSKDRYSYSDSTSQVSCDFSKQNMTDWTSTGLCRQNWPFVFDGADQYSSTFCTGKA